MFLTHFENNQVYREFEFSVENQMTPRSELPMMNIVNMILKDKASDPELL